ncbi:hypothetical protein H010_23990 [Hydrogenophaga taeniospiralis CCUG 15921]|uniref:Sulfatase-modifying factor enzyme domain-containing protein n=1 Tax=Hydrogenophaga taeniospiralis CCUG 15921 TaxID=1281780 RepID=A0A9X4SDU4_9BURK|nr:SUMF1/EgtB/PvdO family nonheme iron enzyme [Hydrogenophaga taeniospiralis]MDG5978333.1 hypothetical protein [Hydrogenophaga taeniospiralis CCUG 15921]
MADDTAGEPGNQQPDTTNANGDYLGYGVYAQTLLARVEAALNKDLAHRETCLRADKTPPPLGDDPLVVGIFGEWGAGKSKLLSLVQKLAEEQRDRQVKEHKLDGYQAITVPVFFQPWKYEHEKHLLVPLLLHILGDLEKTLAAARTGEDKLTGAALAVVDGTKRVLGTALSKVGDLAQAVGQVMGVADPVATAPMATMFQMLAHGMGDMLSGKTKRKAVREFVHSDNGRAYYDMHRILSEVTRPAKNPHVTGDQHHDKDFCLNFVIFIDDLDRCLPEKAVETLELIKTVFNLESFAFVLALDEEVVERGIGHRYKDYALNNKKPEMPITGFEYLEKIVHLPFRLPALPKSQAKAFLQRYEAEVLAPNKPEMWWFAIDPNLLKFPTRGAGFVRGQRDGLGHEIRRGRPMLDRPVAMDLSDLALSGFDSFVPRKLVRLVELLHQVAAVMTARGRVLNWQPARASDPSAVDVRVVLVVLMIQLFQPELFRLMRRRPNAFSELLSAFAFASKEKATTLPSPDLSDGDLFRWVACESTLPHAIDRGRRSSREAPDPLVRIQKIVDRSSRATAQQVRLPLVEQIVQHRAAQRHPFDALKLMYALAQKMDATQSGPEGVTIGTYWSLLAPQESMASVGSSADMSTSLDTHTDVAHEHPADASLITDADRPRNDHANAQKLFDELTSPLSSVQANLAESNGLELGSVLGSAVVQQLLVLCEGTQDSEGFKERLRSGLPYLAPYLSRADGPKLAAFLGHDFATHIQEGAEAFDDLEQLLQAGAAADLRSTLGLDDRFDPGFFHLPKTRYGDNNETQEPIPGFVRVVDPSSEPFQPFEGPEVKLSRFYMARYLTTVDQYAQFIASGGYGKAGDSKPDWWDTLGWRWRTGLWDSAFNEVPYKGIRYERGRCDEPMFWAQQRAHGSRPVTLINWFEARAYAGWLSGQLLSAGKLMSGYVVRLPTEAQWERAARAAGAAGANVADMRQYSWGSNDTSAHLHANIADSRIGRANTVGLFAPNPLGIFDLNGCVWEWQNNLYSRAKDLKCQSFDGDVAALKVGDTWEDSDRPSLCGGSWESSAINARVSSREGFQPVDWYEDVGFRLVLSLAKSTPEA